MSDIDFKFENFEEYFGGAEQVKKTITEQANKTKAEQVNKRNRAS